MKKLLILLVIGTMLVTSLVPGVTASAKSEKSNGAVKVDLRELFTVPPVVVGSAILRTTGDGKLIVNVNMDDVPDRVNDDIGLILCYAYDQNTYSPVGETQVEGFDDVLNTNAQGQGNAQVKVDITLSELEAHDYIYVILFAGGDGVYFDNVPPPIRVPLK